MKEKNLVGNKRKYDKNHLTWVDGKGWEGIVYKYTLTIPNEQMNGKMYIGCTPEEATRRSKWKQKSNPYGGSKIADARKQYGIDNWKYEVLERHYDEDIDKLVELLESRESYYIKENNSIENGFNGNSGGTGRTGMKLSDEENQRRNATRKKKGFHHTDESKKKIGEKSKNRKKSDEEKQKISEGNKGKKRTEEQKTAQSERLKGIEPKAATEGAKNWVKQNGGGYWKNHQISAEAKVNMKAAQQARGTNVMATFKDKTTKTFPTMLDAAKECGCNAGSVKYSIEHNSYCRKAEAWFTAI